MNNMTVGSIRTTVNPPLASGIFEALLEKAERERDEARAEVAMLREERNILARAKAAVTEGVEQQNLPAGVSRKGCHERPEPSPHFIDTPKTYESDTPETCEAVERWQQGKINIFDEMARLERERDEAREQLRLANIDFFNTQTEVEEQARLLGMGGEREARLITERDYYKKGLEEISATIDDWLNSLVQEPPDDFIRAIKAWADKKLNNG